MENNILVHPVKYSQKILSPIIQNPNEINNGIFPSSDYKLNGITNIPIETSEYPVSSPLNEINQMEIISPSIVSSQQNVIIQETIINEPLDTQPTVISPVMPVQNIERESSKIDNFVPVNIRNKSLMGTTPGPFPVYRLLRQGCGINPTEEQGIVFCAMKVFQEDIVPISNNTARLIQRKLGGDWLVIVYENVKPIDFYMTNVEGKDYMYFTLDTTAFQVCRLR